jgi:hypothetical protein
MKNLARLIIVLIGFVTLSQNSHAQYILKGKVTNTYLEPVRYVSVSIKELQLTAQTDAQGMYSFRVDEGKYDIAFTNIGYKPQLITLIIKDKDVEQNIILEPNKVNSEEVKVFAVKKDKWKEIMRNVINNKDNYIEGSSTFSCNVYIRASQENEKTVFKKKRNPDNDSISINSNEPPPPVADPKTLNSIAEVVLQLDKGLPNKIKETRLGVKTRGNTEDLFYLSTTQGEFSLYQNLIKVPAITDIPMLSPVSNAGLSAYNFKTLRLRKKNGRKFYTISFTPVKAGNALIEGEFEVMDSLWVITAAQYNFPNYLLRDYDYFGVEQSYDTVDSKIFMLNRQDFTYVSKLGKNKSTGKTLAIYSKYNIDPAFSKKYFGNELSATTDEAYNQDSTFWEQVRQEPLSAEQLQFIRYNDSVQRAHSTKEYMAAADKEFNRVTLSKILFNGQGFYQRSLERSIFIGPLSGMIEPLGFGGFRVKFDYEYNKVYDSRKTEAIWGNISYGFKNKDIKAEVKVRKLYNTFSRGAYEINASRQFQSLFRGGSWQDGLRRSGMYEKDDLGFSHEFELANGLMLNNRVEMSFRRSAERYKINTDSADYIWGLLKLRPEDKPKSFAAHQAFFNSVSLSYTPQQKYIREPREKIILGSKWPTFTTTWRKGIPNVFGSSIDYDHVEFKINQNITVGLFGVSTYSFTYGNFVTKRNILVPDSIYIRQRDRFVFLNPATTFQGIDSSFPVSSEYYQFHYLHNFKGSIINRIPFMKKLKLQEIVGGGFLRVPEKNLNYYEAFVGLEKVAKILKDRYKIGVFVVYSGSNQYKNPIQLKMNFEKFNKRRNSWF